MSGGSGLSLCECVSVCDKKSVVCYRLSLAPPLHFIPLLPICWNTLFLSSVNFFLLHTLLRGFTLLSHHFEPFPGLAETLHAYKDSGRSGGEVK